MTHLRSTHAVRVRRRHRRSSIAIGVCLITALSPAAPAIAGNGGVSAGANSGDAQTRTASTSA